jgi:hypothetical protein
VVKDVDVFFSEDFELVWNCHCADVGRDFTSSWLDDKITLMKGFGGWVIYNHGVTTRSDEACKCENGFRVINPFRIIDRTHFHSAAKALENRLPAYASPGIIIDQRLVRVDTEQLAVAMDRLTIHSFLHVLKYGVHLAQISIKVMIPKHFSFEFPFVWFSLIIFSRSSIIIIFTKFSWIL